MTETRLAYQVTACAIFKPLQRAYEQYQSDNTSEKTHPQFQFWSQILTFELLILVFVRSIRETNFELYRETLSKFVPFFFALDHRWLPVHLRNMALLDKKHPEMALEFKNCHFAVHKTERVFPSIAISPTSKTIKL